MDVRSIYPMEDPRWLDFILSHEKANIFHHPAWLRVLNRQYGFPVFAICHFDANEKIIAGIPYCEVRSITGEKQWISLPFADHCYPIYDSYPHLQDIIEYMIEKSKKEKVPHIEIRAPIPSNEVFLSGSQSFVHTISLSTQENVFNSFKKTRVQQAITKSIKDGLSADISVSHESIELFYSLHLKTRKKLGVPIQPKRFFEIMYEELLKQNLGFISIVRMQGKPISAGMFLLHQETCMYKFGASDPRALQFKPNHLMLWTAIREAIDRGCVLFDMGKTDLENKGLRTFKGGWGSVESELHYSFYPTLHQDGIVSTLKDYLVSPAIKYSPSFVCRLIGEIGYKYFPSL